MVSARIYRTHMGHLCDQDSFVELQGMNVIKAKSDEEDWNVDLAGLARIWKGGCIIRAGFLDRIKSAYQKDPKLDSLLLDEGFAKDLVRTSSALLLRLLCRDWFI